MSLFKKRFILSSTILLLLQISCSKNPTSSNPTEGRIKISIKSVSNTASASLGKSTNNATITSVRVVIKEIEFTSNVDDTLDFELDAPFVQDLTVDSNLHEISTVQIPFGIYEEMEIKIDELNEENGSAFTQNPDLQNLSIRAEGFLNGDATNTFVFTSDLSVEQEREFNPPLILDETTPSTNVVLTIDLGMWFVDKNNDPLDPNLEGNRSIIERNIKASIKVFEDDDDNGEEDDNDDDDEEDDD